MNRTITSLVLAACAATAAAQPPAPPDCDAPAHRQFDFWLGDWQVTGADGQVAGTNTISREMNGCVLHERWQGTGGLVGESFNLYDRQSGDWHQTWVDSNGTLLLLDGGLVDGSMVLSGAMPHARYGTVYHRISWTPLDDGAVRQHWQFSTDGGETWRDLFNGRYQRAE